MATKEQLDSESDIQSELEHRLILFNDEVNTFDHVIDSLIDICGHNPNQAEQCAIIAHYKGKCAVLSGAYNDLVPKKNGLDGRGLTTEID